ncbi:MAG: carboxypeptidase-like regulatory domain-containing protein [Draconibacterium sp.]
MSKSKKHISEKDFQRYLSNQMTENERHAFERELQKNPFEAEALEGFQHVPPEELSHDLEELKSKIGGKKTKSSYRFWAAAATLLLLVSTGIIWFQLKDKNPMPELTEAKTEKKSEKAETVATLKDEESISPEDTSEQTFEIVENYDEVQSKKTPEPALLKQPVSNTKLSQPKRITEAELKMDTAKPNVTIVENDNSIKIRGTGTLASGSKPKEIELPHQFGDVATLNHNVVRGKVISLGDNQPVPGATIQQKGTTNGTITDINGNFSLKMYNDADNAVVVSLVGMEPKEFYPGKDSVKVIGIEPSQLALDEVVVTGKPTTRKSQTVGYTTIAKPIRNSSAQPIGGMEEFEKYLEESAVLASDYPSKRAVVKVRVYFNTDGEIVKIENKNSADQKLFEKTKQIILSGPEWAPEFKNGENIESETELKIVFRKEKQHE